MLNNIFGILEKIGFSAQKRAINVQFSNEELIHRLCCNVLMVIMALIMDSRQSLFAYLQTHILN